MSRIVCLIAQMILSIKSLNWFGGMVKRAAILRFTRERQATNDSFLTRETIEINRTKKFEEANAMFRVLSKVLIDHIQRRLEDCVQNGRYLRRQKMLKRWAW